MRINRAREDWEARVRAAEEGFDGAIAKADAGLATLQQHQLKANGNARNGVGLVTPPSPRNISSDSGKRHRRKRSTTSRGRSRSHSAESNKDDGGYASSSERATLLDDKRQSASKARARVPWAQDDSDSNVRHASDDARIMSLKHYPITSESSVRKASTGSTTTMTTEDDVCRCRQSEGCTPGAGELCSLRFRAFAHGTVSTDGSTFSTDVDSGGCAHAQRRRLGDTMAYQRIIVAGQFSRSFYYDSIPARVWLSGDPVPPFSALMLLTAAPPALFLCVPHLPSSRPYLFVSK